MTCLLKSSGENEGRREEGTSFCSRGGAGDGGESGWLWDNGGDDSGLVGCWQWLWWSRWL